MEEKAKNAVKTFEDLAQAVADSGRPYDAGRIEKAYEMAAAAHAGQTRLSGESYVSHPVAVACLVVDLGLDTDSVVAALLHDSVEDTETTAEDVKAAFGPDVALLVDGVTKLGTHQVLHQWRSSRLKTCARCCLAMSKDVRVMLIKLCDRLHNMRTGDGWPEQKRRDKALETMEVYAPIAHRLGMSNVKEELEDRSLQYLDPVGYEEIRSLYLAQNGGADSFISGIAGPHQGAPGRERHGQMHHQKAHQERIRHLPQDVYAEQARSTRFTMCTRCASFWTPSANATTRWASSTTCTIPSPAASRTISPHPSPICTSRCTRRSSAMRAFPLRCRSVPGRCTTPPNTAWRPTGNTRRA